VVEKWIALLQNKSTLPCIHPIILGNTFLDAYEVNILHSRGKLKVRAKNDSKLMNLNENYNFALAEMGVNSVTSTSELESLCFLILMFLKVF
jgi:hypothetical protein